MAQSEYERYRILLQKGNTTRQEFDRRLQQLQGTTAALAGGNAAIAAASSCPGRHQCRGAPDPGANRRQQLVAPRDGRIQYRLSNVGEVLPAGGKVFTLLDIGDVYMNIYLPTGQPGRVAIGADARIVLDAYPDYPVPARVSFVANEAQFTPKMVETQSERDKLMFRIKLRIDPSCCAPMPQRCAPAFQAWAMSCRIACPMARESADAARAMTAASAIRWPA